MTPVDYNNFCDRLFKQNEFAIKLGTERLRAALDTEGSPDLRFRSILVAGTNGKGSVSSLLNAIYTGIGEVTGLYTSPHLVDVRERIRVRGLPIPESGFVELGPAMLDRWGDGAVLEDRLTYFELVTLMAVRHFAEKGVAIAVFEVGLGGRLDATNSLAPTLSVITPVSLDHRRHLGYEVSSVFAEKAGILRERTPAVVCRPKGWTISQTEAACVIVAQPDPLWIEGRDFGVDPEGIWIRAAEQSRVSTEFVPFSGAHQVRNAAVALAAAHLDLSERGVCKGLDTLANLAGRARWPGRWTTVTIDGLRIHLDAAHNPAAAAVARGLLKQHIKGANLAVLLLSSVRGKDLVGVLETLKDQIEQVIAVPLPNPRSRTAEELSQIVRSVGLFCHRATDLDDALKLARELRSDASVPPSEIGPVVALGSIYLLGALLQRAGRTPETLPVFQ